MRRSRLNLNAKLHLQHDLTRTTCYQLVHRGVFLRLYQCSPEAPAADIFTSYSRIKRWLLLLDKRAENYALVSVK